MLIVDFLISFSWWSAELATILHTLKVIRRRNSIAALYFQVNSDLDLKFLVALSTFVRSKRNFLGQEEGWNKFIKDISYLLSWYSFGNLKLIIVINMFIKCLTSFLTFTLIRFGCSMFEGHWFFSFRHPPKSIKNLIFFFRKNRTQSIKNLYTMSFLDLVDLVIGIGDLKMIGSRNGLRFLFLVDHQSK